MSTLQQQKYYAHLENVPLVSDSIFAYIVASYEGDDIRLSWQLRSNAPEITDNKFQIYRNDNFGHPDHWRKIGEVVNNWTFLDDRISYQLKDFENISYRIKVNIPEDYFSSEIKIYPHLTVRERLLLRALLRRKLITAKSLPKFEGYLFKRLWKGEKCRCVDALTGEPTNSDCPNCFGTGIKSGYWTSGKECQITVAGAFAAPINFDFQNLSLGTTQPSQVEAIFPATFPIDVFDVWVPKTHFPRFYVVQSTVESEFKGIPLGWKVLMRQASKSDIIYSLSAGND